MTQGKLFRALGFWTVGAVYVLILIGGIVRATGSGMGCPDWPKCFGTWIPPTDISQLPIDYKEIYGAKLKGEVDFNPVKTWIEYINRLVGALIGLLIFSTFISAVFTFWKRDKTIVYLTLLATFLVGFEGWLGSKVVSSELHPVMITLHMILSVIIVFILMYAVARSYSEVLEVEEVKNASSLSFLLVITILFSTGQVLLGTQVREAIDQVSHQMGENLRNEWVSNLGGKFSVHALFSSVIIALNIFIFFGVKRSITKKKVLYRFSQLLIVIISVEVFSGLTLGYLGFPRIMQPVHLTLGILALGVQFIIYLFLNKDSVFRSHASKL